MKSLKDVKVGDEVVLRDVNRREPATVRVTRIGRKLIYVRHYGRELAFRLEDGVANDRYGHASLRTHEEEQACVERDYLITELRRHGVEVTGLLARGLTNDQLGRILAIAEES